MKHFDVIVIGGGPSGLMAAIAAGERGANVLLIDKGNKLGRKLAISGGGAAMSPTAFQLRKSSGIFRKRPFLYSAFSEFNNEDIIEFLNASASS